MALKEGIVSKSGAWFHFEGEKLGQGRDAARLAIKENAALSGKLHKMIFSSKAAMPPRGGAAAGKGPAGKSQSRRPAQAEKRH